MYEDNYEDEYFTNQIELRIRELVFDEDKTWEEAKAIVNLEFDLN